MEFKLSENDITLILCCGTLIVASVITSFANIQLKFDSIFRGTETKSNSVWSRRFLLFGILLSAVGGGMDLVVIAYIPLSIRSCLASLSIPMSVVMARVFLKERVSAAQWFGVVVTVCGTVVAVYFANHETRAKSAKALAAMILSTRVGWMGLFMLPPFLLSLCVLRKPHRVNEKTGAVSMVLGTYAAAVVAATVSLTGKVMSEILHEEGVVSITFWILCACVVAGSIGQMLLMSSFLARGDASKALPLYQVVNGIILSVFAAVIFLEPIPNVPGYVSGILVSFAGLGLLSSSSSSSGKQKYDEADEQPLISVELMSPTKPALGIQSFMIP